VKKLILVAVASVSVLAGLLSCASGARGHGPVDSFVLPAASNPFLSADLPGALNVTVEPKEVFFVVAPGTNVHSLVARLSLNAEATITVISSGTRVVQQNGITPNDFSVPVIYSIEVPGEKQPWRYRVVVREQETNPRLVRLVLPVGSTLQPVFDPAVHAYRLAVPFASSSVRIEAQAQSRFAKSVIVNGTETPGAAGAAVIDFQSVRERPVTIETVAEDGVTRDKYVVTIVRAAPDNNAFLSLLDLQGIPLSPGFSPASLGYQVVVPFETQRLVLHAQPQSPVATMALVAAEAIANGQAQATPLQYAGDPTGPAGAAIDFSQVNRLPLVVAVTAQDGSVQQYLLDIRRGPPDTNNFLADLAVANGALSPDFQPSRIMYVMSVPFATQQVRVIAHAQSRVAAVQISGGMPGAGGRGALAVRGDPTSPDGALVDMPPAVEKFPLILSVTAQDGGVLRYRVDIRRSAPDHNSDLASLAASTGVMSPPFSPRAASYALALPASADSVRLDVAAASPSATVQIAGQPVANPAAQMSYSLSIPPGTVASVVFVVRAEDGFQRQYLLQVSREALPAQPAPQVVQPAPQAAQPAPQPAQPAPQAAQAAPQAAQPAPSILQQAIRPAQPTQQAAQQPVQPPAQQQAQKPAQPAQPAALPQATNPPAAAGPDHVSVTASNLVLGKRELAALLAGKDRIGNTARVTIRPYRGSQAISQDSVPVDARQRGPDLAVSFQYRSAGVSLGRDRLIEIEVAIPTSAGHFLSYTAALPADDTVALTVPFLLYGASPQVTWPPIGSPVKTAGYSSSPVAGKGKGEKSPGQEELAKNEKGEYGTSIEITDAKTGRSYGKDTVWEKPGLAKGRPHMFTAQIDVPEGATVTYTVSRQTKNGKSWTTSGQAQIWTTTPRYDGGFEPVLVTLPADLGE